MMSYLRCFLPHVGPAIFERMRVGMMGLVVLLGVAMLLPSRPAMAASPPSQIVDFRITPQEVKIGDTVTLTATLDQPLQVGYWVTISGPIAFANCSTVGQQTCTWSFVKRRSGPEEFTARLIHMSTPIHTKGPQSVSQVPYEVTLSLSATETKIGETFTYRASLNQPLGFNSEFRVINTNGGSGSKLCGDSECTGLIKRNSPLIYRFVGRVSEYSSGRTLAESELIEVRPVPYQVTLSVNPSTVEVGTPVQYTATLNQPLSGSGSYVRIFNRLNNGTWAICYSGMTCSGQSTPASLGERRLVAELKAYGFADAISNEVIVTVTKPKPKVTLALAEGSESEILPHEGVSLVAEVDQLADEVTITNRRTGRNLQVSCIRATPTTCTASDAPFVEDNGSIGPPPPTVANYVASPKSARCRGNPRTCG